MESHLYCITVVFVPLNVLKRASTVFFFNISLKYRVRMKCHTIYCARNTFLLLQKHLTSGTELILTGWKIVPNEEDVQCDHHFASQPLANEPLHSSQLFDTSLQASKGGQKM